MQANAEMAADLGFPAAAAVTCVKPSGTVSQLCDSASGIHPRHSDYYIRRVRCNKDDPLTNFMLQVGGNEVVCIAHVRLLMQPGFRALGCCLVGLVLTWQLPWGSESDCSGHSMVGCCS